MKCEFCGDKEGTFFKFKLNLCEECLMFLEENLSGEEDFSQGCLEEED